jgi:hypothetical protein
MVEDQVPEIHAPPIKVPETNLVFRLEPTNPNGRYVAIVAAESDEQARRFAADADPFGAEWENPTKYRCVMSEEGASHVVGDVSFQSVPIPAKTKS